MNAPRYFGTDGIRDQAGQGLLTPAGVTALASALARLLRYKSAAVGAAPGEIPRVLIARDTRASGSPLAQLIAQALGFWGVAVDDGGVAPTPALAQHTSDGGYHLGIVISASHNPAEDNGVKLIAASGRKLSVAQELRVEAALERADGPGGEPPRPVAPRAIDLAAIYAARIRAYYAPRLDLSGLRIAVDCAHGAQSAIAPGLLAALGARVSAHARDPDGWNINADCGATRLEAIAAWTIADGADLGVAFDGDADRALYVDRRGQAADGDVLLLLAAEARAERGALPGGVVVGTSMTNLGLELALRERGLKLERAAVGDRPVAERLHELGAVLGGEPSGHTIFLDRGIAGDGLVSLLELLTILKERDIGLDQARELWRPTPQVLHSIKVRSKPELGSLPAVARATAAAEAELGAKGRLVLRYSGTEPLARVMVEGRDEAQVRRLAESIAQAIAQAIGT